MAESGGVWGDKDRDGHGGGGDRGRDQKDESRPTQIEPELWSFNRCSVRSPGDVASDRVTTQLADK